MRKKNSGPFLRGKRDVYYCWIEGHLKSLKTKKPKIAEARYRLLLKDWEAEKARAGKLTPWTVRECLDYYLEHAATMKPNTYRNRKQAFDRICEEAKVGKLPWDSLTADHVEAWSKMHAWSASMRRSAINYVVAAFNYCQKRGKIAANPLVGIEKPRWQRRKNVMAAADLQAVYDAAKGPFRDFLTVQIGTGARPGELCSAHVEHYRGGVIILAEHKEDEYGEDRIIYLTPALTELVERLIGVRTEGPIFRNAPRRAVDVGHAALPVQAHPQEAGAGQGRLSLRRADALRLGCDQQRQRERGVDRQELRACRSEYAAEALSEGRPRCDPQGAGGSGEETDGQTPARLLTGGSLCGATSEG